MAANEVREIKFVRSGGFAGAATTVAGRVQFDEHGARVDGEASGYHRELPAGESERLRASADPGTFDRARTAISGSGAVPDAYQYEIAVVTGDGKSHSLTLGDGKSDQLRAASPEAQELLSWIQQEAQKIWKQRMNTRK